MADKDVYQTNASGQVTGLEQMNQKEDFDFIYLNFCTKECIRYKLTEIDQCEPQREGIVLRAF